MNIAFYFSQPVVPEFTIDNIFDTPDKWPVYTKFLATLIEKGAAVYFVSAAGYQENCSFLGAYLYADGKFIVQKKVITIDVFFDRSKGSHIAPREIAERMYNDPAFKKIASQKTETEKFLGEYMKTSAIALDPAALHALLVKRNPAENVVIKPEKGMRGKGIFIDIPENLVRQIPQTGYPYLVQNFIDTSKGIPGITPGTHDLRVVAVNGKLVMALLRIPPADSLLANVAQGGSIQEVSLSEIPKILFAQIENVFQKIESLFPGSFYSMDFGVENEKLYLFEINDRVGFPRVSMPSASRIIEELAARLTRESTTP